MVRRRFICCRWGYCKSSSMFSWLGTGDLHTYLTRDQSVGVLAIFFLAMILYPEVQQKAKEEIDRVIGNDRLPNFSDRGNLPYLNAVWKESFRWHTLAPMGLPHVSTEDDIIEGYLIPKGAMIIPNVWCVRSNLLMYPAHDLTSPTRRRPGTSIIPETTYTDPSKTQVVRTRPSRLSRPRRL